MSSCEFEFAALDTTAAQRFEAPAGAPATDLLEVVAAARAEAEAIRAEAWAAGHAEGLAAGRAQAAAAGEAATAAFARAVDAVQDGAAAVAAELESEAVTLAFALAEKVLMGALDADPERVLEVIRGALRGMMQRERVILLVNPADMEIVREAAPRFAAELGAIDSVEVMAERRVGRGGAIIRTAEGELDATIETKLARAREVVAGEVGA